jgi:hypothetical protein
VWRFLSPSAASATSTGVRAKPHKPNSLIGRELISLLVAAGFVDVTVEPRMAYADASRPEWVDGFTRKTFMPMIKGVQRSAVDAGLIGAERFEEGLRGTGADDPARRHVRLHVLQGGRAGPCLSAASTTESDMCHRR